MDARDGKLNSGSDRKVVKRQEKLQTVPEFDAVETIPHVCASKLVESHQRTTEGFASKHEEIVRGHECRFFRKQW